MNHPEGIPGSHHIDTPMTELEIAEQIERLNPVGAMNKSQLADMAFKHMPEGDVEWLVKLLIDESSSDSGDTPE